MASLVLLLVVVNIFRNLHMVHPINYPRQINIRLEWSQLFYPYSLSQTILFCFYYLLTIRLTLLFTLLNRHHLRYPYPTLLFLKAVHLIFLENLRYLSRLGICLHQYVLLFFIFEDLTCKHSKDPSCLRILCLL